MTVGRDSRVPQTLHPRAEFEARPLRRVSLWFFPLVLGSGKRLFADGAVPAGMKLEDVRTSTTGVLMTRYERARDVEYGSFALEEPTAAELERRARLTDS